MTALEQVLAIQRAKNILKADQKRVNIMAEAAKIERIGEEAAPPVEQPRAWLRQNGESLLWYNRFLLYKELGPKRSLQAAVVKERAKLQVVKKAPESPGKPAKKSVRASAPAAPAPAQKQIKIGGVDRLLVEAPRIPDIQVPGSWKAACKQWRWVERARASDEWKIDYLTESLLKRFQDGYANKAKRIETLDLLATTTIDSMNKSLKERGMSHVQFLSYLKEIQSIFKDIAHETQGLEDSVTRVLLRYQAKGLYEEAMKE